jgi:hypothetical protein
MFDGFDIGDAFGAGVIGGFINEVDDEDKKLQRLRGNLDEDETDVESGESRPIRIGSKAPGGTNYLAICDDSDPSEDLTEIRREIDAALAFARSRLGRKEKEGARNEGNSRSETEAEGSREN